ncbi:hypothetical protein CBR_g29485 [Chara braunii]|uniref:CCHC-type domain-containing protein n=1 Tax=Chara braunii TaxID=69332 RepID=A0A388LAI8_CHABU|nr:hypothetical protein CBR_g29485 [Chara braunii]|eukprot:GBG79335.1 hypothetical protein CBR_g29485 [Chara braunii]
MYGGGMNQQGGTGRYGSPGRNENNGYGGNNWGGYGGNGGNSENGGNYGGRQSIECYTCGKIGHYSRDCWTKRGKNDDNEMEEMRQHYRQVIQEKREAEERRREEEQRRIQEENEKRQEHNLIRRTEEMRLQLEAGLEEKWRKQTKQAEEAAAAAKAKAEEAKAKAEEAKAKAEEARARVEEQRMRSATGNCTPFRLKKRRIRGVALESGSEEDKAQGGGDGIRETVYETESETTDSENELRRAIELLRKKKKKKKKKKKASTVKRRLVKGKKEVSPVRNCTTTERGECSKKRQGTRNHVGNEDDVLRNANDIGAGFGEEKTNCTEEISPMRAGGIKFNVTGANGENCGEEPRTPMDNGYKGLPAKCSREGIIDYCLSTQKILSAKKAFLLRKICQKKGIQYTRKPEIIDVLAREQVMLAYEGFEEVEANVEDSKQTTVRLGEGIKGSAGKGKVHVPRSSGKSSVSRVARMGSFVVIPIRHANETDDRAFEAHLIRDFSPNLNTCNTKGREMGTKRRVRKGRRERRRRIGNEQPKVNNIVSFKIDGRGPSRVSFLSWLEEGHKADTKKERRVIFQNGEIWADGWKRVKKLFGMTNVRLNRRLKKLHTAKRELQNGAEVTLVGITRTPTTTARRIQELREILRKPFKATELVTWSANHLVGLYRAAGMFDDKKTKNALRLKIDRAIRKKTKVVVRNRVVVKVVYDKDLVKKKIRETTEGVFSRCVKDPAIANLVKSKIRVTWCRNRTVGDVIHNHRRCASTKEVLCTCRGLDLPRQEGHVLTRFSDLKDVPVFVKNAKNVTCHTGMRNDEPVVKAIMEATALLKSKPEDIRVSAGGFLNGNSVVCDSGAWDDNVVARWAMRFCGMVLAPIDSNQGDTAVVCPVLYRHAFGKTFAWNADYDSVSLEEKELLFQAKKDYEGEGLPSVARWKVDGRIGRAYVIPKDKDVTRWRPIAPATGDPAGQAQRRIAKALHYLMKQFPAEQSFYLNSIQELPKKLETATEKLTNSQCVEVKGRCYDIKDMFTRIPQAAVRRAVWQLLVWYTNRGWKQVKVSKRGKLCTLSKTGKATDGYFGISFRLIFGMVNYDLNHDYIRCGEEIKRQVSRIPMGKSTSPILATITCAMSEYQFLSALGADRCLVAGWRVVDDITVVVGLRRGREEEDKDEFGSFSGFGGEL